MESFPPEFLVAFNIDPSTLFNLNGFFAYASLYVVLAAAIMATYIGVVLAAREKITKASEFLMTRPQTRLSVFSQKIGAGIILLTLINVVFIGFLIAMYFALDNAGAAFERYLMLCGSVVIIEFMLFSIGVLLGTFLPRIKVPAAVASGVGIGFFITGMLHSLIENESARFLAPYHYIDTGLIVKSGQYEWEWLSFCGAVIVLPLILSALYYNRRDIESA